MAEKHGSPVEYTWNLKVQQMGLPRMDLARKVISDLQLPISPEQYIRETVEIQETLFPGAKLLPGAERLINHLAESGVPIALATSSPRDSYLVKTGNHQVISFFVRLFIKTI